MAFSTIALRVATSRPALHLTSRVFHAGSICQGPCRGGKLSLTFDDGPHPKWTPLVLDCLGRLGVRATFFVVGRSASMYPELVREAQRQGHEIGTHLYWHQRPNRRSPRQLCEELRQSRLELESILGSPIRWLRFPYGKMGALRATAVREALGLQTVHWTFSALDSRARDAEAIVHRVRAGARAGAIVLMHDCLADEAAGLASIYNPDRTALLQALPSIEQTLTTRELTPVTLSELMESTYLGS